MAAAMMRAAAQRCTEVRASGQAKVAPAAAQLPLAPEETYQYQAEVDRLMDMIVNSLYSNREVFLRELVSNSSDALDKIRFVALTDSDAYKTGEDLEIRIRANPEEHTVTIEDTGIGMTKDELLSSLGTIARSGTAKFAEAVKESQGDANLIGQFGVGFYSSFLVADRVKVQTKSNDDDTQWVWESAAGSHSFKVKADESGDRLPRGTRVTLYLKEDAHDIADDKKLASLIKQYSEFISFPIKLWSSKQETERVIDEEATEKKRQEAKEAAEKEGKEAPAEVEPVMRTESKTVQDWTVQNDNKPLWTRSPKEVTKDEYDQFFKLTFKEFLEPLGVSHFNVEGTIEFSAMLFVPGMAPFEQQDMMQRQRNIRLFVKRVFISDEFDEDLLPRWLGFMKGIVDSSDLPLNVSREILQESRVVRTIRKQLVRRSLDMLKEIAGRPEEDGKSDYLTFWEAFGKMLKLGAVEDQANKGVIAELLRFPSSKSGESLTSLKDYVGRMKEGQEAIYFMAADSREAAAAAPFVEGLVARDYEVLFLTEPIDEVVMQNVAEFDGKKFSDVSRDELDMGDGEDASKKAEEAAAQYKDVIDFMKETLGDKIEKVTVSQRLADSPCALVTSKFGWSANMERIMKSQTMGDSRAMEYMRGRRSLEINPDHPVVQALQSKVSSSAPDAKAMTELMYETALVTSGFSVDSPKEFANRIYSMMANGQAGGAAAPQQAQSVDPEVLGADKDDPWRQ
ncbi:hypothetical protein WJX72_008653 [[Myrmecia] bisecta]|uniref:Histidine kinase/HSP90-like ATPase domain-containing protein n=1 Tax=[Myrmecia] bisecta TaxID=41462 RepID=A0AAW1QFS5_9CHLO